MTPADHPQRVEALCGVCHRFGARGWCRATSGNFSARVAESYCLITRSGREKSQLSVDDLMICDLEGRASDTTASPSAETPLHCLLYTLDPSIGAVLHTHSVIATVLSRYSGAQLRAQGYEMQKALGPVTSHEDHVLIRIFENDQDMQALAEEVAREWHAGRITVPGFLIAGHGLYAWGRDIAEAERHIEGFEFLFECLWQERLAGLS